MTIPARATTADPAAALDLRVTTRKAIIGHGNSFSATDIPAAAAATIALSRYRHNTAAHSATSPERFAVWNSPTTGAEIAAIAKQRQSRTPTILNAASTAASISTA